MENLKKNKSKDNTAAKDTVMASSVKELQKTVDRKVKLQDEESIAKHNIKDLEREALSLTDFSALKTIPTQEELVQHAARIRDELEQQDMESFDPKIQQAMLKVAIEDQEEVVRRNYKGNRAAIKAFFSSKFRRERQEAIDDLKYAKEAVQVLAVINGDSSILPKGIEAPALSAVEKIKKEVDILVQVRDELEYRIDGKTNFFGKKEFGPKWLQERDKHYVLLSNHLGFSWKAKNRFNSESQEDFSLDDYFYFLDIELNLVQSKIGELHRMMSDYVGGKLADRDFSKISEDEVESIIKQEKDLDKNVFYNIDSDITGTHRINTSRRELDIERVIFDEARESFYAQKVIEFIENNKEKVSELADLSIFLQVQTHLMEIDNKNPYFELDGWGKQQVAKMFDQRVVYSALKTLGLKNPPSLLSDEGGQIARGLEGVIEQKLSDKNFQTVVKGIVEKCYGKEWKNNEMIKVRTDTKMVGGSTQVYSEGLMIAGFSSEQAKKNYEVLQFYINHGAVQSTQSGRIPLLWWPHPLGIVTMDQRDKLILNNRDLLCSVSTVRYDIQSSPAGILFEDYDRNIYLNGDKVGVVPSNGGKTRNDNKLVGLSKGGVVAWKPFHLIPKDNKAGVYVDGKLVCEDNETGSIQKVEAVLSDDFNFAISRGDKIYLDGKYPLQINPREGIKIANWYIHPRGIIVEFSNKEFQFYSFEAVKEGILAGEKEAARIISGRREN